MFTTCFILLIFDCTKYWLSFSFCRYLKLWRIRRAKPFHDHVFVFSIVDYHIWFWNYQVTSSYNNTLYVLFAWAMYLWCSSPVKLQVFNTWKDAILILVKTSTLFFLWIKIQYPLVRLGQATKFAVFMVLSQEWADVCNPGCKDIDMVISYMLMDFDLEN